MECSNVTCTSSLCSQLLCCTHPSIGGTSLKPSPLSQGLSKMHTSMTGVTEMQISGKNKMRYTQYIFLRCVSNYLVQLPNMILKKYLGLCVQSFTQRLRVCNTQGINVAGFQIQDK